MKLKIAIRAFVSILFSRDHIFSDERYNSVLGNTQSVNDNIECVIQSFNEEVEQNNVLLEYKEILKQN